MGPCVHGVNCPKNQGEACNGTKEGGGRRVLALDDTTSIEAELINNDQVGNASHGIPSPLWTLLDGEGGEETGQDHDDICNDGDKNIRTVKTSQKAEIEEKEGRCEGPVYVTGPVNLSVDGLGGVWKVLLGLLNGDFVLGGTVADGHGEIGEGSEGGDESSQNVEHAFLLGSTVSDSSDIAEE